MTGRYKILDSDITKTSLICSCHFAFNFSLSDFIPPEYTYVRVSIDHRSVYSPPCEETSGLVHESATQSRSTRPTSSTSNPIAPQERPAGKNPLLQEAELQPRSGSFLMLQADPVQLTTSQNCPLRLRDILVLIQAILSETIISLTSEHGLGSTYHGEV